MHDIVTTVKREPTRVLDAAHSLYPNPNLLWKNLINTGTCRSWIWTEMSRKIRGYCKRYQKPSNTGIILNSVQAQCTKGADIELLGVGSKGVASLGSMENMRAQWLTRQILKIGPQMRQQTPCTKLLRAKASPRTVIRSPKNVRLPMLIFQNRGKLSQYFASRLRSLTNVQVFFTTWKLQSWLPSLKSDFSQVKSEL